MSEVSTQKTYLDRVHEDIVGRARAAYNKLFEEHPVDSPRVYGNRLELNQGLRQYMETQSMYDLVLGDAIDKAVTFRFPAEVRDGPSYGGHQGHLHPVAKSLAEVAKPLHEIVIQRQKALPGNVTVGGALSALETELGIGKSNYE